MIRFIHTADIHFGMENYGKIDPATGIHTRLLDFSKAFDFCVDYAIEQQVDFFLFCGDAYKTPHPTQTQQKLLLQSLLKLYKANIPIVSIVGNHDNPLSFGKAHALDLLQELPLQGFHVFSKPGTIQLQTKNGPINIVGIPWPTKNTVSLSDKHSFKTARELTEYISQAVGHIIKDCAQNLDPHIPAVLAGHLTVSNGIFSGSEKRAVYGTDPILLPSQLAIKPFDYVALGHLHRYQNLNPHGYPALIYSGSIERVDFGERKEEKGFCVVEIKEKGKTDHTFIKTPSRPFIQIEVKLDNEKPFTDQIIKHITRQEITDAVIKIIYQVPAGMKDSVDNKAIEKACSTAAYIVGIFPQYTNESRTRRTEQMQIGMDLEALLNNYFEQQQMANAKKNILLEKTLALLDQDIEE